MIRSEVAQQFSLQNVRSGVLTLTSSTAFTGFAREFLEREQHHLGIEELDPKHIKVSAPSDGFSPPDRENRGGGQRNVGGWEGSLAWEA